MFAFFINEIQKNGIWDHNIGYLLFLLSLFLILVLVFWIFHGISRILERQNAFLLRVSYKKYLFEKALNFNLDWHNNKQSGDSIDKIEKSTSGLYEYASHFFLVIRIMVKAIGTIVALFYFWVVISVGVLVWVIIGVYVLTLFDKKLVPQYKSINKSENKISAKIYDSLSNITSVIILNIKQLVLNDIGKSFFLPFKVFNKNIRLNEWKWFAGSSWLSIITILPITYYVFQNYGAENIIEIGTISALYLYLNNLGSVFFGFSELYSKIIIQKTSVENASGIEYGTSDTSDKQKKTINLKHLKLKKLDFAYKQSSKILDNLSVSIQHGEKIAIIGHSGSGKTTFLKILHGLYPFSSGSIILNEKKKLSSLAGIDLKTTLVPQEPELFVASIRENITFGLDYSDKKIKHFTDMACFEEVIQKLPKGLKSKINERGVNLSGGQKQRLALARALLFAESKNMILLDESTSSVDAQNEAQIYKNILKNFSDKTVIASIHKLNLLKYFDRILLFEDGKIICDGDFKSLLKDNKKFARMWKEFMKHNWV